MKDYNEKNNKILASVKMYTLNHIYDYKWTVTSLKINGKNWNTPKLGSNENYMYLNSYLKL